MDAYANGKAKGKPAMYAWRDTITREALRTVGQQWTPIDGPVHLDVVFTLAFPANYSDQSARITADEGVPVAPAMQPADLDKLLRATQDALSPLDRTTKPGAPQSHSRRFKVLADDSRVVSGAHAKTYPTPGQTHPWALDCPGAVIRISMLDAPSWSPMPPATLRTSGQLPAPAAALHRAAKRRPR